MNSALQRQRVLQDKSNRKVAGVLLAGYSGVTGVFEERWGTTELTS